jgi:hypothetical protein
LPSGSLIAVTSQELADAGRLESPAGRAALILAARIDVSVFSADTGSSVASLVRQFHASLAEALKDAGEASDPVDELQARRERKLAAR